MRNPRLWRQQILVIIAGAAGFVHPLLLPAQTSKEVAWKLIRTGLQSHNSEERIAAVRVLGLVIQDGQAAESAEAASHDSNPEVRRAAATALGQMRSTASIARLKEMISDKDIPVVLAAARALVQMKDKSGYEVYYEILTGKRKGSEGLIAQQTAVLHDPKKLAKLSFEEGIGYIPYAGMGWDALRTILKNDSSPIRAAAATMLAENPDPKTALALVNAAGDKNWVVRVAAIEAIAKRSDAALRIRIEPYMYDPNRQVRYAAAATTLRLFDVAESKAADKLPQAQPQRQ
jgi:HEAT repeat protein